MSAPSHDAIVDAALDAHPRTFAEELGGGGMKNTPSSLYRLLCFAHLASTRIRHDIAIHATKQLFKHGWTTPGKLLQSTWEYRVKVLNEAGYARYDESTSARLAENAKLLIDRYRGDLRKLRNQARRDPPEIRRRLKALKGIGDVGVDIFFRDAQLVWDELYPFVDRVAQRGAKTLGLPDGPEPLARLAGGDRDRFVHLLAALVRIDLQKAHEHIQRAAA